MLWLVGVAVAGAIAPHTKSAVVGFPYSGRTLSLPMRLRGGSIAQAVQTRPGGGWQGAQSYLETTGINITATAGSIAAYRSAVTLCNSSYLDDPFAALFARELAGQACGPRELLDSGWTNPRQESFTQVHADQILDEVLDDMMDRINAEQNVA